jgi:hypothetical protein
VTSESSETFECRDQARQRVQSLEAEIDQNTWLRKAVRFDIAFDRASQGGLISYDKARKFNIWGAIVVILGIGIGISLLSSTTKTNSNPPIEQVVSTNTPKLPVPTPPTMDSRHQVRRLDPVPRRDEPLLPTADVARVSPHGQERTEKMPSPQVHQEPAVSPPLARQPDLAPGQNDVRQMITYAMANGGLGNEDALLTAKRRLETLKPKRLTDAPARKRARGENERGLQYMTKGQIAEAAQAFQAAYQEDPTDIEIINNLGDAYQRLSNLQAAEPLLLRVLVLAPGRTTAWANLGVTYAKQGQHSAAVACLANAYRFSRNQEVTRQFFQKLAEDDDNNVREVAKQTLQLQLLQTNKG